MTELVFTAGERAILDLRDSAGDVTVKDWDGPTIKVEAPATPYVLREQDTFRLRLSEGGVISLPIGLPAEVLAPGAVRVRVTRAGGETEVRAASPGGSASGAGRPSGAAPDFTDLADAVADHGKRIFREVARTVRSSGTGVSDDVARKLEEAAERLDETARRAAERAVRHAERHAERAVPNVERHAERATRHAERAGQRVERGARRGRWWFTERMDEWGAGGAGTARTQAPRASESERLTIMQMLRDGKISAEQAATLLDALGG